MAIIGNLMYKRLDTAYYAGGTVHSTLHGLTSLIFTILNINYYISQRRKAKHREVKQLAEAPQPSTGGREVAQVLTDPPTPARISSLHPRGTSMKSELLITHKCPHAAASNLFIF